MLLLFLSGQLLAAEMLPVPGVDPKQVERQSREVCEDVETPTDLAAGLDAVANMVSMIEEGVEQQQLLINRVATEVGFVRIQTIVGHDRTFAAASTYDRVLTETFLALGAERRRLHEEAGRLLEQSWDWEHDSTLQETPKRLLRRHCRAAVTRLQVNLGFTYWVIQSEQAKLNVPRDLYRDALYIENNPNF